MVVEKKRSNTVNRNTSRRQGPGMRLSGARLCGMLWPGMLWPGMLPLLISFFVPASVRAQSVIDSLAGNLIENLMERQTANQDASTAGPEDLSRITGSLNHYLQHPMDLNNATAEELDDLYILNDLQISALLNHIRTTGPLMDLLELQAIPGFDLPLVRLLLPFVTIGGPAPASSFAPRELLRKPEQEILLYYSQVLARQKGYKKGSESRLPGGPERFRIRYRFLQGEHFRLQLLAEKDPGEAFSGKGSAKGFDFYSAHLLLKPSGGVLKKIVLGDYLLQFGQGLVLWNGFSLGKGPAALNIARQGRGIRAHSSAGESYFFRGLAATAQVGKMHFTPFISRRKLDATPAFFGDRPAVSAIRRSGLHRTRGELAARNTLKENLSGLNLRYQFSSLFSMGLTAARLAFDKPLLAGDDPYELYDFSGRTATAYSLDYTFGRSNYFLFGEIAGSRQPAWEGAGHSAGWAAVGGLVVSPAPGLTLAAAWRNYGRKYQSLYGSPFGESSAIAGERGYYLGLESRLAPAWTLTAYVDAFSWSWLRYRVDAPSQGYELLTQLTFRPAKSVTLYGRYRKTRKPRNAKVDENHLREVTLNTQQSARIHAEFRTSRRFRLRTRADFSFYRTGLPVDQRQRGYSIFQDIAWIPGKLSFHARFTFFNTDNYDTRIYAYESGLIPGASLAFYYDKGFKTYLRVRWRPKKNIDLSMRGGLVRYINRDRIGSGPDEISGKQKPDIGLRLRIAF